MSLEFMDGFDHMQGGGRDVVRKWDTNATWWGTQSPGRFGGLLAQIGPGGTSTSLSLKQGQLSAVATRVIGFAFYYVNVPTTDTVLVEFFHLGTSQVDLRFNSAKQFFFTRNGTVLGSPSTQNVVVNTWYYFEVLATINPSAGVLTFRVTTPAGAMNWLNVTGVNSSATGSSLTDGIAIRMPSGYEAWIDDLYILNTSGTRNNAFLGECRIMTVFPFQDGFNLQWTTSSGTNHWDRVSENPGDDDSTYNSTATVGNIDTYDMANITPPGAILGVQTVLTARKDDPGARQMIVETRSGGVNRDGVVTQSLNSNYLIFREIMETDPATSAPWTASGLNATEFGAKLTA